MLSALTMHRFSSDKGKHMLTQHSRDDRVLELIVRSPGGTLEDIVLECPDLTWNQLFITIDRLSREGALTLTSI